MTSYANGKIYGIRSYQTGDVYYGSTVSTLTKRLSQHKKDYKQWQRTGKKYITSFEIVKHGDAYIELVELFPCDFRSELEQREGQIIRLNDDAVNKIIAGRTQQQYRKDNIEQISAQKKQYRKDNSEHIKARDQQYRTDNSERISAQKRQFRKTVKAKLIQQRLQNARAEHHASLKAFMLKQIPDLSDDFFKWFFKNI